MLMEQGTKDKHNPNIPKIYPHFVYYLLLSLLLLLWESDSFENHSPAILPATLSTASFNLWHCLTTLSFSSSAHSAMNVAVSEAKPEEMVSQAAAFRKIMCTEEFATVSEP
jgi:hypothetical protein